MPAGLVRMVARLVAVLVTVGIGSGLQLASWPQAAVAAQHGGELLTCLNLATGVTRVPTDAATVAGTTGSTTVALTWVAPLFTGRRAVNGYSVQVSTSPDGPYADAAGCTGATTSTGRSCTATGLTNGTAYYFKVAAINIAGTGPYSIESAPVTPAPS